MIAFLVRRLLHGIIVMATVAAVAFLLFRYAGDPVAQLVGQEVTAEERELIRDRLGLNDLFIIQYVRFIGNTVSGNFGVSFQTGRPVANLIWERLPATVELTLVSAVFALTAGLLIGAYVALYPNRWVSRVLLALSLVGISLPSFFFGILMILVFSVQLRLMPSFGRGEVVDLGWWSTGLLSWSGLKALVMPALTLGLFQVTLIMRVVRAEMLEVLHSDYIRFARARGLSDSTINFRYALKNTLVPVITIAGLQVGSIFAFAIIVETVFQWPGLGLLFLQALQSVDIPIVSTYLVFVALFFVLINITVDILYYVVDPRIRKDRRRVNAV